MGHRMRVAVLLIAGTGVTAQAQVSSERGASVVVFPKVIVEGSRDTLVQLVNGANTTTHAYCWYTDAQPVHPGLPPGPLNPPRWQVSDFRVVLTHDQPTSFVASRGRLADPLDEPCATNGDLDCYGAGFDPGRVPALPFGFTGELRCVETDAAGFPLSGNHLTGEATLIDALTGDASKYSAIGIAGLDTNDSDPVLRLGEEYTACPQDLVLDHALEGVEDEQLGAGSAVDTELTLVACSSDLESLITPFLVISLQATSELGVQTTAFATVPGWGNLRFSDISPTLTAESLGAGTGQSRLQVTAQSTAGVLGIAEEIHRAADGRSATAAVNVHTEGVRAAVDLITLP